MELTKNRFWLENNYIISSSKGQRESNQQDRIDGFSSVKIERHHKRGFYGLFSLNSWLNKKRIHLKGKKFEFIFSRLSLWLLNKIFDNEVAQIS